jgi:G patch domain-containing protein 1
MDDEDFSEHGIAPRNLKVKADYNDPTHNVESNISSKKVHTIDYALDELIKPAKNTIGVRMMRRMGWREGTGVGPKIKRKLRKLKSKLEDSKKKNGKSISLMVK